MTQRVPPGRFLLLEQEEEDLTVVLQADSVAEGCQRMAQGRAIETPLSWIPLLEEGAEELVKALQELSPSVPVLP